MSATQPLSGIKRTSAIDQSDLFADFVDLGRHHAAGDHLRIVRSSLASKPADPLSAPANKIGSRLSFREISAKVSKFTWTLEEAPLPLLPFFSGCGGVRDLVYLLTRQVECLRRSFWASLLQRARHC